ncbi:MULTISPECIES: aminopeptidase [Acidobacterium]|uniref:Peptidase, M29 (Aminopeptidase T) family n=1 Tax=Acidobacterium capsulatum (strain ATCC 51196 / DSM 11244 / BCRC 80197 / JCM 7670 / NBRC 15755 / NCIMB 13165 / 161) TaxID=240015 RepID=C1F2I9_ACIC5|nr:MULTISPECIES: aminopeptidase [Acidobacterium]ACO33729.1 peptidase, M29 (aminopeptidase T) family [Acidobacterium capsulatum ATCC 51196]HCT60660.1 aminopeptidase [Acidobacterium sp.]
MSVAAVTPEKTLTFEQKLDRLADVAVRVGLGLKEGQELVLTASVDTLPLVRRITAHAYEAGASLVTTLLSDEASTLLRYRHGKDASFDKAAGWLYEGMAAAYASGAARMAVAGANPALLSKEDPEKVGRANRSNSIAYRPALELITKHAINWTIVPAATPDWAKLVFPDLPADQALARLWDAIFAATRVDREDPVAAWKEHDAKLHQRADYLNKKRYHALHFRGPGTDLTVGLADDHLWLGGGTQAHNGQYCIPNLPTEEVFTTPHKDRVNGTVTSTKPLSHQGTLIEKISVRFENGRIVEAHAAAGEAVLQRMIETDAGARMLGEVALVPHSSPISASGVLFWNTLFDENAACHIALGQAYSTCVKNGENMKPEELAAKGANESLIHVDWMIGSGEVSVDGVNADGSHEPLMVKGEFVTA